MRWMAWVALLLLLGGAEVASAQEEGEAEAEEEASDTAEEPEPEPEGEAEPEPETAEEPEAETETAEEPETELEAETEPAEEPETAEEAEPAPEPEPEPAPEPEPEPAAEAATDEPAPKGKKSKQPRRELPSYDGRSKRPLTPAESAAWIPRVLLAPLYVVSEYLIRIPAGALATGLEKNRIPDKVRHVLSFGSPGKAMWYPTALIDFGFRPSIGLSLFANDAPGKNAKFRFSFAWGGNKWWLVSLRERIYFGEGAEFNTPFAGSHLSFHFRYLSRPDYQFYGYGPTSGGTRTRFTEKELGGGVGLELVFGKLDGLTLDVGVTNHRFEGGHPNRKRGDLSIEERFNTANIPGWDGYTLFTGDLGLVLDSRKALPAGGSGVRLVLGTSVHGDLEDTSNWFLKIRGEVGAALDLNGGNRVLATRLHVQLIEPLTGQEVPMAEQIALGGNQLLRGIQQGRYRGMSSFVTTVQYSYPIWVFLDGFVFAETGNVFGTNFAGFHPEDWTLNFGIGFRSNADRDARFNVLIAAGTTRFGDENFKVDSFRLVIGNDRGL
ncbi:MAG: hypothetical protein KDA24_07620 [Deltaproteobacteria bacterium]|nr:hypothetical protein [Deltaproteobacteria bacterium]